MDQAVHRVSAKERNEIKVTTKKKMARRHSTEKGNCLEHEDNGRH